MIRPLLLRMSGSRWVEGQMRRRSFARRAVRRFMPGESLEEALDAAAALRWGVVLTELGENVGSRADVERVRDGYLGAVERVREREVDAELSVKPTHLGLDLGEELCTEAIRALAVAVGPSGGTLWVDMEDSSYVDRTLALVYALQGAPAPVGVCLQAYLHRTPDDLEALLAAGIPIRLVKGAYREPPDRTIAEKREVDRRYLELARKMRDSPPPGGRHVLGTHDTRILRALRGEEGGLGSLEVQMLYGIGGGEQARLWSEGVPLRTLISYGESWFPWYMRRLAERPANLWFVLRQTIRR